MLPFRMKQDPQYHGIIKLQSLLNDKHYFSFHLKKKHKTVSFKSKKFYSAQFYLRCNFSTNTCTFIFGKDVSRKYKKKEKLKQIAIKNKI